MRWTGDNTAAFQAWVQTFTNIHQFTTDDWSVSLNAHYNVNALNLSWTAPNGYSTLSMIVPLGGWAVFGPYWGTDPTLYWQFVGRTPWTAFVDDEFQREYVATV